MRSLLTRRAASLLAAAHPVPSAAVTLMVTMLALRAGAGWRALLVAAAVLTGQLSIGWLNDWHDAEGDVAAARADKPVATGAVSRAAVGRTAATSGLTSLLLSIPLGVAGLLNVLHLVAGYVYDLWAKPTRLSIVPYLVAFGLFPSVASWSAPDPGWPPVWMTVAGALLGAGGHVMNVLPDLEADRRAGVYGFPQWLGRRGSLAAAVACLGVGAVVAAVAVTAGVLRWVAGFATAVVVLAVTATAATGRTRLAFRLTVVLAVATVGFLWLATPR